MLPRTITILFAISILLAASSVSAEVSFGTDVGVDMGMVAKPGVSVEERVGAVSYLHLLGLSVTTDRFQFVAQTGIPIPPAFSVQAVLDGSYYPRSVRQSGPVVGTRLRLLPIWWIRDRSRCIGEDEFCHAVEGSWGGLVEPSLGWQFPISAWHLALRPTLAYSAGIARAHNDRGAPQFHHGGVFTLHVQTFARR